MKPSRFFTKNGKVIPIRGNPRVRGASAQEHRKIYVSGDENREINDISQFIMVKDKDGTERIAVFYKDGTPQSSYVLDNSDYSYKPESEEP